MTEENDKRGGAPVLPGSRHEAVRDASAALRPPASNHLPGTGSAPEPPPAAQARSHEDSENIEGNPVGEVWLTVSGEPCMGTATLATGAPPVCSECGVQVGGTQQVVTSGDGHGWCVATLCQCGWYTRESRWYRDLQVAETAFATGSYSTT